MANDQEQHQNPLGAWDANATRWDQLMGSEGNDYFRELELPAIERLAKIKPGDRALDLATGNGLVARWLAQQGASSVIATDGSPSMLDIAYERTAPEVAISFEQLDVTSQNDWTAFVDRVVPVDGRFDLVTMNMAIMDIPDLKPLAMSLPRLLKPGGCFIATVLHPIFFTSGAARQFTSEEDPATGTRKTTRSIVMTKYMDVPPARQYVTSGMSVAPFVYHRPMGELFSDFFQNGLVLDALEELNFDEGFRDPQRELASKNFEQFPKILAFRMRFLGVD